MSAAPQPRATAPAQAQADAHVIVAAPALLDLAKRCEPWLTALESADIARGSRLEHSQFLADLSAAIATAAGRAF